MGRPRPGPRSSNSRTQGILATVVGLALVAAAVSVAIVGWGGDNAAVAVGQPSGETAAGGDGPSTGPDTSSRGPQCPGPWDCAQQKRFESAKALIASATGVVAMVVRDRETGAEWLGGNQDARFWAGSTPKLALAVALREQERAGEIKLDLTANNQIDAMLAISDDKAADALWNRYANASTMLARFRNTYGMSHASYVSGFPSRWGFVKTTPGDLANLMVYILDTLDPTIRATIVKAMRTVGQIQRWGVWSAGAALNPGVKNGWSQEIDDGKEHWITATVGFAGPHERYVVAAMYHQPPGGDSIGRGVHALTDLVATVFGNPVPAPAAIPAD